MRKLLVALGKRDMDFVRRGSLFFATRRRHQPLDRQGLTAVRRQASRLARSHALCVEHVPERTRPPSGGLDPEPFLALASTSPVGMFSPALVQNNVGLLKSVVVQR